MSARILLICALSAAPLAGCSDDDGGGGEPSADAMPAADAAEAADSMTSAVCFDEAAAFRASSNDNVFDVDPVLVAPTANGSNDGSGDPVFAPGAGSPVLAAGATPPTGGFFDRSATFAGAIGATDWTAGWTAYPVDTAAPAAGTVSERGGTLDADETWSSGNTYRLTAPVFVTGGATLTIEPGVVVKGMPGSSLVITRDGAIDARGTAAQPIIFTSNSDSGATAGDWGGVVLLGSARLNVRGNSDVIEGFTLGENPVDYGGTDDAHDCGTLRYVRIEYAGFELSADNELNGLTIGGCGSATEIDYVQVHRGADDGIELFGGTAEIRHVVVTAADDDGLDWDQGWTGRGQFIIVQQIDGIGDKGMECDSNKNDPDASPRSAPELWNVTLIGRDEASASKGAGAHFRRGTGVTMANAIVAYFPRFAIDVDGAESSVQAEQGGLSVTHTYFFDNAGAAHWPPEFDVDQGDENDCRELVE